VLSQKLEPQVITLQAWKGEDMQVGKLQSKAEERVQSVRNEEVVAHESLQCWTLLSHGTPGVGDALDYGSRGDLQVCKGHLGHLTVYQQSEELAVSACLLFSQRESVPADQIGSQAVG
jgi:hypothetical protein